MSDRPLTPNLELFARLSSQVNPGCYHSPGMTEYCIGLDLGGTNLRAAAIDREGKLLHHVTGHTQYAEGSNT